MRNIHNAISDVATQLRMEEPIVEQDPQNAQRFLVRFYEENDIRLEIEVIDIGENAFPVVCVLQRHGVGYRRLSRIMDTLISFL